MVFVILWILLPPFRVVSLDEDGRLPKGEDDSVAFDASVFADRFWTETIEPNLAKATDLSKLAKAVSNDAKDARERLGRGGEGAANYYFAGGEGVVRELKGRRATLDVQGVQINLLIAGPVFGNTVRDGTGLLNVNELPGLEEFNAVSAALNQKVEGEIMPPVKGIVQVGSVVSFVGCSKAPESLGDGPVLEFTPLRVEVVR